MAVLTNEGKHIGKESYMEINRHLNTEWMRRYKQKETRFVVEAWRYSNAYATVSFVDKESTDTVCDIIKGMGYSTMEFNALKESKRPTKIFSCLLKAALSEYDKEMLSDVLAAEREIRNIPGRMEYYGEYTTDAGNKILKVKVCDLAEAKLKESNYFIRLAAGGTHLLVDIKDSTKAKTNNNLSLIHI